MNSRLITKIVTRRITVTILTLVGCLFLAAAAASAKTITVTGTADTIAVDGVITLREAMTAAKFNLASGDAPAGDPGLDTIKFSIAGGGVHTIILTSDLPAMTSDPISIDGTSQPGYAGSPLIELNGNNVATSGLFLQAGNCSVKALVINRVNGRGIVLSTGGGNTIAGSYIGLNASGTAALPNTLDGIFLQNNSSNNIIGGAGGRNVISGNSGAGIFISSGGTNNTILGNFIGTNAAGTGAVSNAGYGVRIDGSSNFVGTFGASVSNVISGNNRGIALNGNGNSVANNFIGTNFSGTTALGNVETGIDIAGANNTIGGANVAVRNVISANGGVGINLLGSTASGNLIAGNYIGTDVTGALARGNQSYGIQVIGSANNVIGGTSIAARNVISGNGRGIGIGGSSATNNSVQGNYIGVNAAGTAKLGNNGSGVEISSPNNSVGGTVAGAGNLISGNVNNGVLISAANGNQIKGNLIGTNAAGTAALDNGSYGIRVINSANTIIGGTTSPARNVISGNDRGIALEGASSTANTVQGNYIGVDINGDAKVPNNGSGVEVSGPGNFIGGTAAGAGNLISGNTHDGISITGASGNSIQGNLIGTNAAGTAARGNDGYGIRIIAVSNTTIGGTTASARNIVSGNGRGISIEGATSTLNLVQGNYIGVDVNGFVKMANGGSGVAVSGPNNTIGGAIAGAGNVISGNANDGVDVTGEVATGNKVQGNLIGTNSAGGNLIGNTGEGIRIIDASNTLIGGTTALTRNIISGNFRGITFEGSANQNLVQGNYIGTDITGTQDRGNLQEGIVIYSCPNNTIGGTIAGAQNVISGNDVDGIRIDGAGAFGNLIQGNFIGTRANGVTLLPNTFLGVNIYSASKNTIGGTVAGAGNTIGGNNYAGVLIASGVGNAVLGNSIFSNARLGIEMDPEDAIGLLENDLGDPDTGANWRQNYPLLTSVTNSGGNTNIQGKLNSNPNKQFRLEFFSNNTCDASGFGEGQFFLGSASVTTDSTGDAVINVTLPGNPLGQYVTATATSPSNDTSEFSPCALVGGANPGVLQFESSFFLVEEALGTATIIVTRSSGMTGAVTVNYATTNGTAKTPADYASTSGTLTFGDGEVIKKFTIPIVVDGAPEAQETINLTLSGPGGGATLGANTTSTLFINDADPLKPGVIISNVSLVEGDSGTTDAVFTISLTTHSQNVTVGYATANGLATAPDDYQNTNGQLVFTPAESSKTVSVPVIGDGQKEGDEMFFLNLTSLSAGYVIKGQGQATITDDDLVSKFQLDAATYSINENGSSIDITVLRKGDTGSVVSVDFATTDVTANAGQDYAAVSGTLNFAGGEISKKFAISITDDGVFEGDETLSIALSNASAGSQLTNPSSAVLTIVEDDQQPVVVPGTFNFRSSFNLIGENGGQATIIVRRTNGSDGAVSVQYSIAQGGTASAIEDYAVASGTLSWADGDAADKTFTVAIVDDALNETDETLNLALSNPTGGAALGNPSTTVLTIADNDAQPSLSISDVSQAEGKSGTTNFSFNVTLSAASGQTITVDFGTTANGTAAAGSDYQPTSGTLTFNPGETSKQVTVVVNGDTQDEPNETFVVQLSNGTNAGFSKDKGTGTIVNDDSPASPTFDFSQANYGLAEQLGAVTVTVTRSGDSSAAASVDYATGDGSAIQKSDYEITAGTLNFAPGEVSRTFSVLVNQDSYVEGPESFNLVLSNPSGAVLGPQGSAQISITDDAPETMTSPIDDSQSFVYMHYHDFLNREPDQAGLQFWTNQIESCGSDVTCREVKRTNVSAAFFLSIEFQKTGYLLYLFQKESFASLPMYTSFMRDLQEVSRDVVVNSPGWEQKLADNQQQFAEKWVNRPEFKAAYDAMSNADFVNALYAHAGVIAPQVERDALVTALDTASSSRAAVLLDVAENATFKQQEQNPAFVLMQYFGYLRRDPNAAPDSDLSGYNFWLNKLNSFNGDYQQAEMVKSFIVSGEYRARFGVQ